MDTIKLAVQERKEIGNGPSRRLRAAGRIPGVVYGKGSAATPVSIGFDELKAVMAQGHNIVLDLDLDAQVRAARKGQGAAAPLYAVVKERQYHPIRRELLHVDLHEVDLTQEIEASVAIELVGTAAGAADGGVLDWTHREVTVRALPNAVPQSVQLDITELLIGHNLTVGALSAVEGVAIVDDPDTVVASMLAPRVEAEAAAGEEAAEPEVVGGKAGEE